MPFHHHSADTNFQQHNKLCIHQHKHKGVNPIGCLSSLLSQLKQPVKTNELPVTDLTLLKYISGSHIEFGVVITC